jgi:hypothetical protein
MSKDEIQKVTLGTNEALRVTADGEFVWHPEADAMIEYGDFTSSPAMRHILRALRKALAAPVQEPFGYLEIEDIESHSEYPHNCRSVSLWHEGGEGMVAIYTTPPAAPDLQAELDATNRQVEILSDALSESRREVAALKAVQEPEYWNVIDPAGNIVASETDAIRGWARIAGSYKPTVEGLLGFHDQGWRVLPKVTPPAAPVPLTDDQIEEMANDFEEGYVFLYRSFARAIEAAHGITKGQP